MRLSVAENGPCPGVRVLLNGIERTRVIEADEERRFIVIYKVDERGRFVLNHAKDEIVAERIDGDVAIVLPQGWRHRVLGRRYER